MANKTLFALMFLCSYALVPCILCLASGNWQPAFVALRATYLPAYKAAVIYVPIRHLYICRERSTNQLLFMQNKPNFQKAQINANSVCTRNYKNFIPLAGQKNKPNSNPNKPNLKRAQMNINSLITKNYRKKDDFLVRINKPNSKPIPERPKMNVNLYVIDDYENKTAFRPPKNKPNSNPIKACPERSEFTLSVIEGNGPISKAHKRTKRMAGK